MARFYGNMAYISCGNGCHSHLQALLFNENGEPQDADFEKLQQIYNEHRALCSEQNPYENDFNAYYGDPQDCTGFNEVGVPESGLKYCEF